MWPIVAGIGGLLIKYGVPLAGKAAARKIARQAANRRVTGAVRHVRGVQKKERSTYRPQAGEQPGSLKTPESAGMGRIVEAEHGLGNIGATARRVTSVESKGPSPIQGMTKLRQGVDKGSMQKVVEGQKKLVEGQKKNVGTTWETPISKFPTSEDLAVGGKWVSQIKRESGIGTKIVAGIGVGGLAEKVDSRKRERKRTR